MSKIMSSEAEAVSQILKLGCRLLWLLFYSKVIKFKFTKEIHRCNYETNIRIRNSKFEHCVKCNGACCITWPSSLNISPMVSNILDKTLAGHTSPLHSVLCASLQLKFHWEMTDRDDSTMDWDGFSFKNTSPAASSFEAVHLPSWTPASRGTDRTQ